MRFNWETNWSIITIIKVNLQGIYVSNYSEHASGETEQ